MITIPKRSPIKMEKHHLEYDGSLWRLFGIWLLNVILTTITLGIYSFWGKTRIRKYLVSSVCLDHDRFEYYGKGGELFKGLLKALPFLIIILLPFILMSESNPWQAMLLIILPLLLFIAKYGALRYRLSRTMWRSIRGHLGGSAITYALTRMLYIVLNILTLGVLIPFFDTKLYRLITENTRFGHTTAHFTATSEPLFVTHFITGILAIPTLGISRFWYAAARLRHQYAHTRVGGIGFVATYTGGGLLWLTISNLLIVMLTFGLGTPAVFQRNMRYFCDNLLVIGNISAFTDLKTTDRLQSSGEGLDQLLDSDLGFI